MPSPQRLPLFIVLILFALSRIFSVDSAYLKSRCGFQSQNYTIKWAFEPQTQNVVFVLKAKLPGEESTLKMEGKNAESKQLITGIGFGNENELDFIGILSINDQLDLVSGHIEGGEQNGGGNNANGANKGKGFKVSPVANGNGEGAKNGVRSISLKRREADGSVIAEFARPLNGREGHNMADLSGCTTFFLVTQWIQYEPGAERNELPMSATVRRNVCALAEKCSLDVREVNGQNVKEEEGKKVDSAINSGPQRDNGIGGENSENPELGQSVDISGKGDPCSFSGTNYALRWTYNRATDSVEFVMKQKPKKGKWWSAVGIGDNMSDMDIGIIFLEDGTPKEMADYFSSSYDVPDKDKTQDWKLDKKGSKWDENEVELHFARKLVTEDAEKDRSLDGCVLFQFAANAGRYGPGNRIHKHEDWPDLYKACDLKKRCIRQKRQSSNEEENLPIISHSTDEKGEGNNQKQPQNGQTEGGPNSSGDKVINLLMKSLGPQIVKTVSESESAIYNSTSGPIEGEKASPTGAATIFSIIEEGGEEEGNYTQQNGNGQREKTEGDGGGNSEEEGKGGKIELKPIGEKRQEQNGEEGAGMQTTQNAETAPSTTSPLASIATSPLAGEEGGEVGTGEQTYSTLGATSTIAAPAIPGNAPQQNTGSPFSLNAFLGGEQTSPENLVPVGEPGPNGTTKGPDIQTPSNGQGGGEIGPSTSVVRISGEATSAEKGKTTPPAGGGGFGINQMFGGEGGGGSTNSGREEAVEGGNEQNNQTTNASSIGPSEGSTLGGGSSTLVPGPSSSGEESQEGHPAEEGPQIIGSTQLPPFNNSLPPSPANPLGSSLPSAPPNESSSTEEIANEAAGTTYGVPNTTAAASEGIQSSTGGFELIASAGPEGEGTSTIAAPTTLPTIGPSSSPLPPSTPIPSSSPAPISTGLSPNGTTANDENELYSTPTTKSSPTEFPSSPSSSISTVGPSSTGAPQNRMSIEGENSNGLEDGGNELPSPTPSQSNGGNNGTSAAGENVGNGNALEKPNGPIAPQTGSGELEERGIKLPVATSKCDALRPDLPICQSYMGAYMERVKDWAERHGEAMSNQYPKACKLLSAVPHVPTLCCQIFAEKCADYI